MENQKKFDRRQFIKLGLTASAGALLIPPIFAPFISGAFASPTGQARGVLDSDPHFFLMVTLPNPSGLDASYLWDARPLEMTQKGLIQNYRATGEPTPWVGSNGVSTLATELVQALVPFQSNFSVLNGVVMDVGFDGHDQNINYLFTGDPFGGEGFIPHLNQLARSQKALDAIQRGRFSATQTNGAQTIPLNPSGAKSLISSLSNIRPLDPGSRFFQFLNSRFQANSTGTGGFSAASGLMQSAFNASSGLSKMMMTINTDGVDSDAGFVQLAGQVFSSGAAKAAVLVLDQGKNVLDTHDAVSAAAQPKTYGDLVNSLLTVFSTLKNTPFDGTRSLLDVTTIMFSAEFGRTMRQVGKPIDATGTDHDPLSNCVLLGGKGVRGGQVIGSSDFLSSTEVLSGAHLSLDPGKMKIMGKPFDFTNGISRTDLPTVYHASDYLGFNSVVNTVYSLFGISQNHWRLVERNGAIAPVVSALIS